MASPSAYATTCCPTTKPMPSEVHRLHPLSWLFITASSVKGLIFPLVIAIFAFGGGLMLRLELLSVIFVVPTFIGALIRQAIYNYRFGEDEMVVREGLLFRKERHIPYDRVHNIALVQNPVHRLLGVASARVETAAGGKPEAVMRVLSLEAVEELRRQTLGKRQAATGAAAGVATGEEAAGAATGAATGAAEATTDAGVADARPVLLQLPPSELVRLGLISNRGFIVVAAAMGLMSQAYWWELDWERYLDVARDRSPGWASWLVAPGSLTARVLLGVGLVLLFLLLLRLFSVGWYLVKYYGFTLRREDEDLRTEFGLFTRVSSLIPVHRIQLLTTRATLLHRWLRRTSIDVETAGTSEAGSDLSAQLAASGVKTERQWMAPIIETARAADVLREVMPEIHIATVEWKPIEYRAVRRIMKKATLVVLLLTLSLVSILTFLPLRVSSLHALWFPLILLPAIYLGVRGWVRFAAYALTDNAVLFRSGWLTHRISVVRFNKMQTVSMAESPFDRWHRMASVAVDTAGAGRIGHRIDIPFLDVDVAKAMLGRLYAECSATEFRW